MATAPATDFKSGAAAASDALATVNVIANKFSVTLFSQDDEFKAYYDWALATDSVASNAEKNAAEEYSGYALRFDCNISTATASGATNNFNGSGCCLRDASDQKEGGYCLL